MNNMTFGGCLKDMLLALNISMSRLAKSIHVDSSLVNRWVHGERIPPYGSCYIEDIAEYLSKNVQNEFQINNINDILHKQGMKLDSLNNTKDKIKMTLLEAQGYSFQVKKKNYKDKNAKIGEKGSKEKKYSLISKDSLEKVTIEYQQKKRELNSELKKVVELSCNDKVIFGSDIIYKYIVDLLNEASDTFVVKNKTIYMTFNNNLLKSDEKVIKLRAYLSKASSRGWKIIILLRIDSNVSRILSFNTFVAPLLIQGGASIYYYKEYGLFDAGREIFVIPEIGAISSFANSTNSGINTAFLLRSSRAITVFEEYFKVLIKNNTHPLIRYYPRIECRVYCSYLAECEESIGNRMIFKSNLSTIMLPEHIYCWLLKKSDLPEHIRKLALNSFKIQCNSFINNIIHYECKEIYLMDSICNLIKDKEFYLYYYIGVKKIKLDTQHIVELLENVINNLKTYNNYNISFINKKGKDFAGLCNFSFVLKERKALFFENLDLEDSYPSARISIDEPFFVNAYSEFFGKKWDSIAPLYKDKVEVIRFLRRHINVLKGNYVK